MKIGLQAFERTGKLVSGHAAQTQIPNRTSICSGARRNESILVPYPGFPPRIVDLIQVAGRISEVILVKSNFRLLL